MFGLADNFEEFLQEITVNVTEMFRDPGFFKAVREKVFPYLSSYPQIKVWNAGCSSGEELYSFAILLAEEELYDRSFLYGTDINSSLKRNTLFSIHNLVSDGVFNEFQIISCRNVLIYFTVELQERVLNLFYESLCPLGFLCLGSKEFLRNEELARKFRVIDKTENIYQKIE